MDELDKRRIEYRKDLAKSINHIKKELEDVNIKYRFQKITYKNIFPASQWAQSLDNIFIEIKFAHRHDSPGCLEVEDKKIDLKEDSLSFSGTCSLGDDHIRIDYNINFAKKINVALSKSELGAVGRYRFTLKKAERGFWEEMHSNMRIWYEMKEKYQDELMGYEKDEDEDNDKDSKEKENDKEEETKNDEPKKEEPKKDESKKEEPKKEESKKEDPKKEDPKKEESKKEEPKKEEIKKEETIKEDDKNDENKK